MSGPAQIIIRVYDNSNPNDTVVVNTVAGGVLIFDASLNPSVRALLTSDISDITNILALMKLNSAQNLNSVTGLTGGGTNFDNSPTANGVQGLGAVVKFVVSGIEYTYKLTAGTVATSSPNTIQPLDYNVSTNQVYWQLICAISTQGGTTPIFKTGTAITSGAGSGAGTLSNAPAAGNPTKWIPINDNGTTRYIPAW